MSQPAPAPRDDLWWASPPLRDRLRTDPVAAVKDRGITLPYGLPPHIVHEFARVVHLLWVDGRLTPVDQFRIDPADEGLLFGRGAWESTKTIGGVPWLWPLHLSRLLRTCELLAIPITPDRLPTTEAVTEFVRTLTGQDVVVRLNVTAGRPGHPGVVWMTAAAQPLPPTSLRLKSVRSPVAKGQAYLTLKTFGYAGRLRLAQEAAKAGFDTALIVDPAGHILEAAQANIFVRFADGWWTPPDDGGFLPGTVRQHLLEQSPIPIRQRAIPLTQLAEANEAFVSASNVGLVPVTQIDAHTYPVGDDTRALTQWVQPPPPPGPQYRFVERVVTPR